MSCDNPSVFMFPVTPGFYVLGMGKGEQPRIVVPLLVDKEGAPIDELDDHILLLEFVKHRLDVEWTESLAAFEDRDGHEVHGYPSIVAYLKHRARMVASRAKLEGSETPDVGGEKPHINIFVDIDALEGTPGGLHETEGGRVLDVETIRQLSCDSSVSRIVWKGRSEILDVGRPTRVIPAAIRRAVISRDHHCVRKGCSRKPRWCDVHHIISWADGGETVLENLCLLAATTTHWHTVTKANSQSSSTAQRSNRS